MGLGDQCGEEVPVTVLTKCEDGAHFKRGVSALGCVVLERDLMLEQDIWSASRYELDPGDNDAGTLVLLSPLRR